MIRALPIVIDPRELIPFLERERRLGHDYCGICGAESALYVGFPHCRNCNAPLCPQHEAPGSREEHEIDHADGTRLTVDACCQACLKEYES